MGDVFANGLEVSGKAVGAKTIAEFPDVCMTPPENPATPPGVPVPYPNFAMAGDTEKGTGKVLVKGKEANLKNKSDMSKTSGDEAGAAAKKGVVTSKNTGKSFFKSWSPNVKFETEPVVRMTDLTTNNHASDPGNAPPFPHIAKLNMSMADCEALLLKYEMLPQDYDKLKCDEGYWKEHTVENQFFACRGMRHLTKGGSTCKKWKSYADENGKCICMHTIYPNGKKSQADSPKRTWMRGDQVRSRKGSDHKIKSAMCADSLYHTPCQSLDQFMDTCVDATLTCHEKTQHLAEGDPEREKVGACLKNANKEAIKEQLDDENKEDFEKKSQGRAQCHDAGGGCDVRAANGKSPSDAMSSAESGRMSDARAAGRC
ncbi:DUF4150 domain-containing protein [Litorisediminicola beolgyonensis]|uniref:DUF4150 domain-containing protein n=1 Tax=Litorisediminicola beolgyonensis TaxID=1173614 RepID=A0ABW3ZLR2_9RHOB